MKVKVTFFSRHLLAILDIELANVDHNLAIPVPHAYPSILGYLQIPKTLKLDSSTSHTDKP